MTRPVRSGEGRRRFGGALLAATVVSVGVGVSQDARAERPVGVEVGATGGWATNPVHDVPNALGFEIGARAGLLLYKVYAGVSFAYSFGGTPVVSCAGPVVVACTASPITVSVHSLRYGVDGGYDIPLSRHLSLRPELGGGSISFSEKSSVQIADSHGTLIDLNASTQHFYLEPAFALVAAYRPIFFGVNVGLLAVPKLDHDTASFAFHGQLGVKF